MELKKRDGWPAAGLVFIHIGKTAGTAFRSSVEAAIGERSCSPPFVQSYMTKEEADYYNSFTVICGHISRNDQRKWFPDRSVMTILREPVERGFSFLNYVYSLPEEAAPIARDAKMMAPIELIQTEEAQRNLHNTMVRQLGGHMLDEPGDFEGLLDGAKQTLSEAFWVGFQSRLLKDFNRLPIKKAAHADLRVENRTPRRVVTPENNPEIMACLKELSRYDLALWEWACKCTRLHE